MVEAERREGVGWGWGTRSFSSTVREAPVWWEELGRGRWAGLGFPTRCSQTKDAVSRFQPSLLVFHWEYPCTLHWLHLHGNQASH